MNSAAGPYVGKFAADVASGTPKSKHGREPAAAVKFWKACLLI
jgi:hypothetical protein